MKQSTPPHIKISVKTDTITKWIYVLILTYLPFSSWLQVANPMTLLWNFLKIYKFKNPLTEVAGEGGPDLAPQKFLLSEKFRHLMKCKKYLEKFFLFCLVSEIQLFVYKKCLRNKNFLFLIRFWRNFVRL